MTSCAFLLHLCDKGVVFPYQLDGLLYLLYSWWSSSSSLVGLRVRSPSKSFLWRALLFSSWAKIIIQYCIGRVIWDAYKHVPVVLCADHIHVLYIMYSSCSCRRASSGTHLDYMDMRKESFFPSGFEDAHICRTGQEYEKSFLRALKTFLADKMKLAVMSSEAIGSVHQSISLCPSFEWVEIPLGKRTKTIASFFAWVFHWNLPPCTRCSLSLLLCLFGSNFHIHHHISCFLSLGGSQKYKFQSGYFFAGSHYGGWFGHSAVHYIQTVCHKVIFSDHKFTFLSLTTSTSLLLG